MLMIEWDISGYIYSQRHSVSKEAWYAHICPLCCQIRDMIHGHVGDITRIAHIITIFIGTVPLAIISHYQLSAQSWSIHHLPSINWICSLLGVQVAMVFSFVFSPLRWRNPLVAPRNVLAGDGRRSLVPAYARAVPQGGWARASELLSCAERMRVQSLQKNGPTNS